MAKQTNFFLLFRNILIIVNYIIMPQLIKLAMGAPLSQFIPALPGQPAVRFRQYGGFITIDGQRSRHLFYYFVEASRPPNSSMSMPLTLWLNGGPGCSSLGGGAFTELGPFHPNPHGDGLLLNPFSWNRASHLLFLESPVGVGFSYSDTDGDDDSDDAKVASQNLAFLLAWFLEFPEYQASNLFLTGESYAGHYIPQLADLILKYNADAAHGFKLNLQGIAIGNPLLNYGLDTSANYAFLWSHGVISDQTYEGIKSLCDFSSGYPIYTESDDEERGDLSATVDVGCTHFLRKSVQEIGGINLFDVTIDTCKPDMIKQQLRLQKLMQRDVASDHVDVCTDNEVVIYLNRPVVQIALHANTSALASYRWEACTTALNYAFEDQLQDMLALLGDLLHQGLRVWVYSGDQDSVVPLTGTRTQIDLLANKLGFLATIPYSAWHAKGQVGGWTCAYGNLTYATVRGAAHMVPFAQPERALVLFEAFISGKPLPSR